MKEHWQILKPDPDQVRSFCRQLDCSAIAASVLVNRNITTVDAARHFLNPSLQHLKSPCGLKDVDVAVERIEKALQRHERILVFGDYDVDGVTATAVLYEFLMKAGAAVLYYLPHRLTEGYSIQPDHIEGYAIDNRIDLVITADCGSSSHAAAMAAQKSGIDLIITDHHKITEPFPEALALINPQRADDDDSFTNLAGVGVAFALVICLRKYLREKGYWNNRPEPNLKSVCDLVALGTIADSVPLTGENRIFTRMGLDVIHGGNAHPGIEALLKICRTAPETVSAEDIAFRLVPRLNAAGRMDHADRAAGLLLSGPETDIHQQALVLDDLNSKRKQTEQKMLEGILRHLHRHSQELDRRTLVLADSSWHEGVLGIVAARLTDRFRRPVVLISTREAPGKGSARCIEGINLYNCLNRCKEHLQKFGGHAMAAGLTIEIDDVPAFREQFDAVVEAETTDMELTQTIAIDYEIQFDAISDQIVDEIERLEPFGSGNPEPVFMARNVLVRKSKIVGSNHRKMNLYQAGVNDNKGFEAIQFNVDTRTRQPDSFEKVAFQLRWNWWNGRKTLQMVIKEAIPNLHGPV
jgi:single-stranded-DNA-specific exonuclease